MSRVIDVFIRDDSSVFANVTNRGPIRHHEVSRASLGRLTKAIRYCVLRGEDWRVSPYIDGWSAVEMGNGAEPEPLDTPPF